MASAQASFVDLTQCDDNENDEAEIGPRTVINLTQEEQDDHIYNDEEEEELPLLYTLNQRDCGYLKIVGIRYYKGIAREGEYVNLVREPTNPYDRNAIRVDNMGGEKVGHVAKEAAAVLAPAMDQFVSQIQVDASIPWRGNKYFHPLSLDIRAPETLWNPLRQMLQSIVPFRKQEGQNAIKTTRQPTISVKKLDWKQQQAHLDHVWQNALQQQLHGLAHVTVPDTLQSPLFPHQLDALRWLVHREQPSTHPQPHKNPFYETIIEEGKTVYLCQLTRATQIHPPSHVHGGILADDMGLGKTLQIIALILAQPPPGRSFASCKAQPGEDTMQGETLPALHDIGAYPITNLRKAAMSLLPDALAITKKADVVQTLHQALVQQQITPSSFYQALQPTSTKKMPATLIPKSMTTANAKPIPLTLIVAPVSVLSNWQEQIETHVAPKTLRVGIYQGPERYALFQQTLEYDIWITSYHTIQADYRPIETARKAKKTAGDHKLPVAKKARTTSTTLFDLPFFRVILDEAHTVRNPKSSTFRACEALQAERRWCVTGTPLTNKPDDIQSLLQFLRLEPLVDRNIYRRAIAQPIREGDERGLQHLRLSMAYIALRRSKQTISLPDKNVEMRSVTAIPNCPHQKIYDTIYQSARATLGAVLRESSNQNSQKITELSKATHSSIFEVLTRLRQACCSGTLVPQDRLRAAEQVLEAVQQKDQLTAGEGRELLEKLKGALQNDDEAPPECAICMEEMNVTQAVVLRQCGHVFCSECLKRTLEYKTVCAFCRKPYNQDDLIAYQKAEAATIDGTAKPVSLTEEWTTIGPSPKMDALLLAVGEMKPDEKGVVFSQFTKFLDQLGKFLSSKGWSYVRIDGSKSRSERVRAMQEFGADEGPRLILCSLHAAGTGINLTRGNHVFLMDTWWNKAVEEQAQDRIHRLGQQRACRVVRFVAAESVESRLVDLQEAKAAIGKGVFETLSPEEKRKARMEDLKKLLEL